MRKPLLFACIIAIILLATGITVLSLLPAPTASREPVEAAPPAPVSELKSLIEPFEDISVIRFIPDEGTPYSIRYDHDSAFILEEAEPLFRGEMQTMYAIAAQAVALINMPVITNQADESQLSAFGLDTPSMTVRYERNDGSYTQLLLGVSPPAGQGRYAKVEDSREVFLLTEQQSMLLSFSVDDIYDISFFPFLDYLGLEAAVTIIDRAVLETEDGVVEIMRRTPEELEEAPLGSSAYHILQPLISEGNEYAIRTRFFEDAVMIFPSIVEAIRPGDLSVYGLDTPARLTLGSGQWSRTLLIGDRDTHHDGRFVMLEGYDAVLVDLHGNYSFLDVDPASFRSVQIWLHNIDDVALVEFVLDGETRVLSLEHNTSANSLIGFLDGEELSETNTRRLYVSALLIQHDGETNAEIPQEGSPTHSVTINLKNGNTDRLELYNISDSELLIVHNGENTGLYITRMSFQHNILRRFNILDTGGDIPIS